MAGAGLLGLGLAMMPKTLAHATVAQFEGGYGGLGTAVPARPLTSRDVLIERAKAALDTHADKFQLRDRIGIADFSVASREMRFHIVDLIDGRMNAYLVAHGKGSDPEHSGWLQRFSNVPESEASSDGVFRTGEIYEGEHGQSMRLIGLDPTNNMAEPRAIVIHGAPYVSENIIASQGKLGRSQGCFAVAPHMLPQVLAMLGQGRMLYSGRVATA
ncbi:MAG TPA: murein L,D-transpeptidase catalytic domain family protein [Sphingomonas sp.]|nr:murein L,D-transpeptidase catalytic domain family protein [Sphingomonas sp.]